MKPLVIGDNEFKGIIEDGFYYVDKTAYIKEIMDNFKGTKLFLRPRRFGKTTNMLMLKEYFDITKKEENKDLFKGLYVDTLGEEYKEHQNAYPVIFMTLKKAKQDTWEVMYDKLMDVIIDVYNKNDYVKDILKENEVNRYNRIVDKEATIGEYQDAIGKMTEYLYRYHNKKVIVLIDEYDAPLNRAYLKGFGDEAIGFIRSMLGEALKDNSYLKVGVVTGVLQIGQQSIFSELNNFDVYSVLTQQASEHFGFTKEEVKQILKDFNMEDQYEKIEKWYNGYNLNGVQMFNPWSMLKCIQTKGICEKYWANTGNSDLLTLATEGISAQIAEVVGKLLKCMMVEVKLKDRAVYEQIKGSEESFLNTLLFTGYLTVDKKYQKEDNNWYASVRIPNKEVRLILEDMQKKWLPSEFQNEILDDICSAVIEQNEESLQKQMKKLILEEVSYFSTSEDYYKGMFMTAMLRLPKGYIRSTETESGRGRSDYEIYKEDKSMGMIYEFKVCSEKKELKKIVNEGMKQIYDREYYTRMQKLGVKEIWLYSIGICKKESVIIKKEKLEL